MKNRGRNAPTECSDSKVSNELTVKEKVYGKFYGSNVLALPQRHQLGTTNFILPDDELTIVASTVEKPIKCVYEGDSLIIQGNPTDHGDLTHTWFCAQRYGIGVVAAGNSGIGKYKFTA